MQPPRIHGLETGQILNRILAKPGAILLSKFAVEGTLVGGGYEIAEHNPFIGLGLVAMGALLNVINIGAARAEERSHFDTSTYDSRQNDA